MLSVLKKLFLVGSLLLVFFSGRVQAQDDAALIISDAVEVVFPAGVSFSLELDLAPDDLTGLSLIVEQNDRRLHSGTVDLDAAELVSEEGVTRLAYFVETVPGRAWQLFEPVTYEWTVTSANEQNELEGEFVFEPAGYEWRHSGESPLAFSLFDDNLNTALAGQAVRPAYDLMVEHTGLTPEFLWLVQPADYRYCPESEVEVGDAVYPCDEATALQFFAQEDYRILERTTPGLLPFQRLLVMAMFEEFYGQYWRGADVPDWFFAGLRQYYAVTADPYLLRLVQEQGRLDGLFGWPALVTRPDDAGFWEEQAYALVLYLADVYGAEAPFELAQAVPGQGFDAAWQAVIGRDRDVFLLDWERWLFTEEALAAAAWTVYLPETPTPTLTVSPRSTIPIAAPTVAPTGNLTVTEAMMPLATLTSTAMPTLPVRPTVTPIPSNTPRPPGSLSQSPASSTSVDDNGGSPAVCPAVLLPLMMLPVAFVSVLNRRKRIL